MRTRERKENAADELRAARDRIAHLEAELASAASRDSLITNLITLPTFRGQLELEVERAQRYGRPLTVVVIDVDRFRYLNMKHGYSAGDEILAAVGSVLTGSTRTLDLSCRSGADEFVMLLSETLLDDARIAIDRIVANLEGVEVAGVQGITVSIGMAGLRQGQGAESVLGQATLAMEAARNEGGGRIKVSDGGQADPGEVVSPDDTNFEVVAALAQALEERDQYTGDHSESVVDLTERVGEAMALDATELRELRIAALLHDIGKVGIPDEILHKPGPLDEREWEIMRQHPAIGERIMRSIPGMSSVARIVRHEHERWDGGGYPDGIAGEAIPRAARIILACDAYHAMVSDRPYRQAMPHNEAMAELTKNAGTQFDPGVVEALVGYLYGRRQAGLEVV